MMTFLITFIFELVLFFFFSIRSSMRTKESRNMFNYLMFFGFTAFLVVRIVNISIYIAEL